MFKGSGAYALLIALVALVFCGVFAALPWEQFPSGAYAQELLEPVRPGQENSIKRAVFAEGRLWLLSDAGELWTVREEEEGARRVAAPDPVMDLCVQQGRVVTIAAPRQRNAAWTVRRWAGSDWEALSVVRPDKEGLAAIACETQSVLVLTTARLVTLTDAKATVLRLSQRVPARFIGASLATPGMLFVGINAGEFGGGLMRIDRRSGEVVSITSNESGDLCGGPLNKECDPVNGLAVSPASPDCVAAAIGLVHMLSHGRIVEVCGTRVTRRYYQPLCPDEMPSATRPEDPEPHCTVAFFGLARTGDGLLALGVDGLYQLDKSWVGHRSPLPVFKSYGPFRVSFDAPGYVLVVTSANQRFSLSGATPLVAVR